MATVPTAVTDLSSTVGSNWPAGSDTVFPELDNGLRAHAKFIRDLYDDSLTKAELTGGNSYTGSQVVAFSTLTDGATITPDAAVSNHFRVVLGGNRTLANPTNAGDGCILNIWVKQDGTGSRTLAYGSKYKWPSGSAPTLTTTASALDIIVAQYNATLDIWACTITKDFR